MSRNAYFENVNGGKIMFKKAEELRMFKEKKKIRKEEKNNNAILKSKTRNKFFCSLEYLYLLIIINYHAILFQRIGVTIYRRRYRFSEKTLNKLRENGFEVYYTGIGLTLQILW